MKSREAGEHGLEAESPVSLEAGEEEEAEGERLSTALAEAEERCSALLAQLAAISDLPCSPASSRLQIQWRTPTDSKEGLSYWAGPGGPKIAHFCEGP